MIKLISKNSFDTPEARKELAGQLSILITGKDRQPDIPYTPDNDDYWWCLDDANNWKLRFFPEEPRCFGVQYRYQNNETNQEEAFTNWYIARSCNITPAPNENTLPS